MKFRLNVGRHRETDKSKPRKEIVVDGKKQFEEWPIREYGPGDIIESNLNLVKRHNSPGVLKFERVLDEVPASLGTLVSVGATPFAQDVDETFDAAPPTAGVLPTYAAAQATQQQPQEAAGNVAVAPRPSDTLSTMSVKELQKMAQEEEIDLKGSNKKEEIIAIIQRHFNG